MIELATRRGDTERIERYDTVEEACARVDELFQDDPNSLTVEADSQVTLAAISHPVVAEYANKLRNEA